MRDVGTKIRASPAEALLVALRRARDVADRDYSKPLTLNTLAGAADRPYGVEALFRDDSGNWFSLTQSKRG